jgi:hypothetical protein
MTLLERLKIWSLDGRFALFPFAVVPPADLAGNIGLVSADLRLWESRSDFKPIIVGDVVCRSVNGSASY